MKIDKTFIISLPHRLTDRLVPLIDYLKGIGLDYHTYSAIRNNDGRLGLIKTIQRLFAELVSNKYDHTFLVLEDDCRFLINPIETIKKCFKQLPEDWDCLSLGCNLWQSHVYKYSENLIQLSDSYSTHSIVYSKIGMVKVLNAIETMTGVVPLDVLIKERVMQDNKCFCTFPILTTQCEGFSDIENKIVNYNSIIEKRFADRTAHLK